MKYVLGSMILYIVYTLGITKPLEVGFSYLFTPAQKHLMLQGKQLKEIGYFFQDMWLLRTSYNDLYKKYTQVTIDASGKVLLEKENSLLKSQLSHKQKDAIQYKSVLANLYPNSNDLSATTKIIDVGSDVGVRVGSPVIHMSSLIGIVQTTSFKKSTIILLTSPQAKIPAFVQKKDRRVEGIVTGQFGTTVALTRLLPEDDICVGDFVYTSNRISTIPQGFLLGRISKVTLNKANSERLAYLEHPIDYDKLYQVFVLVD